jgi:hypothetical protein
MEVKVYKQKVKHLLYEQENHLAELKAESMVSSLQIINQSHGLGKLLIVRVLANRPLLLFLRIRYCFSFSK